MQLITFPNLSSGQFPKLRSLNAEGNVFREKSNFIGATEKLNYIIIHSSSLFSADGLEKLQSLFHLGITNNKLETLPDLLGLQVLGELLIKDNFRMNCDKRMCWRRLWNSVRNPLQQSDDVICVEPPLLAGHSMATVNPKFMQCNNGKWLETRACNILRNTDILILLRLPLQQKATLKFLLWSARHVLWRFGSNHFAHITQDCFTGMIQWFMSSQRSNLGNVGKYVVWIQQQPAIQQNLTQTESHISVVYRIL